MDGRDQKGSLYCPDTTSRRLQCLHSRSLESLSRTIPDIADLLNPLEDQHLILALTGRQPCSREERDLLALPVECVHGHLSLQLKRHVDLAMEKGASSWLSVLPLDHHNFSLHKGAFKDAICLLHCRTPQPSQLIMPLSAPRGASLQFDTASLLSEVCHNVSTEPRLQPLSGKPLTHRTAITSDDARLDIRARGFWSAAQDAYFDVCLHSCLAY